MSDDRLGRLREQVETSQELQDLLLQYFKNKLENNTLTGTEAGHLLKLLMESGWNLDPAKLPQELSGHLTSSLDPSEDEEEDAAIIPFAMRRR